jgi:hypothetical protein
MAYLSLCLPPSSYPAHSQTTHVYIMQDTIHSDSDTVERARLAESFQ